jgi:hypothetical protein
MKRALANCHNLVKQEPYLLPTRELAVHPHITGFGAY